MAGAMGNDIDAEILLSALGQLEFHEKAVIKSLNDAAVKPGDPLYVAAGALIATTRFSWTVLSECEGVMRRGANRIAHEARERNNEAREQTKLTKAATDKVYSEAADRAVKQLDERSEEVARIKVRLKWAWSGVYLLLGCAATAVAFLAIGIYLARQYAEADLAAERAQFASERARAADTESALLRGARIGGADRADMWRRLIPWNDPVQQINDCRATGRITTSSDGRRSCTIAVWIDPPSAPPVR